ncbi:gamma-glutamylcyclotransferase family protein [Halostagnicola sp. A-GB9-2]|uniref:gamma-glutamylcyclotransferase family protein n=1 Tax=Halostagnicola sp. A-GB9-2 TaxID=3048066 RepID=UPI0024C07C33|nr:gamma-glutamylcyclotransferase family protein [Halostagnicola sp. A-GB9-2]MDJ1432368.1 gamma-glutamylcyclotransferase family protein [Halostagnicola sp. A-GB9-2]
MHVFVYGTLTNAARAEAVLNETTRGVGTTDSIEYEFAGDATLEGLHRVDGEYPTLVPGGSVDGQVLEALDTYEGVDHGLYVRAGVPWIDGPESAVTADEKSAEENAIAVCDHEASPSSDSDSGSARETGSQNVVWTYIGDPDRLDVESVRDDNQYWPETGPFRDQVRRHLEGSTVGVRMTE